MNAANDSGQDLVELLNVAGPEWMQQRVWTLETAPEASGDERGIEIDGPGFCYRWEEKGTHVEVDFLRGGGRRLASSMSRMLVIEASRGTIRVHIPGRESQAIGAIEPGLYQEITELIASTQGPKPDSEDGWLDEMSTISAGMRLITLTYRAAAAAGTPGRAGRRAPKKDQLVTQLHEWLRPNLVHSVKLGDAAKRFEKSPRQLIRILKETTGAGFAGHLNMHRLTLARSLLMRTGRSVREIARLSGFNSREQFIRSFSKAFGWTPLQFRKAWNEACLAAADLTPLCRVSEREEVRWLPAGESAATPEEDDLGEPHTMAVTNALHEIAELFWVSPQGKQTRIDVLEQGGMVFVNRDRGGSVWVAKAPNTGREWYFITPDDHALAIISGDR